MPIWESANIRESPTQRIGIRHPFQDADLMGTKRLRCPDCALEADRRDSAHDAEGCGNTKLTVSQSSSSLLAQRLRKLIELREMLIPMNVTRGGPRSSHTPTHRHAGRIDYHTKSWPACLNASPRPPKCVALPTPECYEACTSSVPSRYRASRPAFIRWHQVSRNPMKFRPLHDCVVIDRNRMQTRLRRDPPGQE